MEKISVLFENPNNDRNVSAIARTCEFYGCDFYITRKANRLSSKASAGVLDHKKPTILNPTDWRGRIIVTDSSFTTHPKDFEFEDGDLIVFGNENTGVSGGIKDMAVASIGIKSKGIVPCLNVAAAVASILGVVDSKAI